MKVWRMEQFGRPENVLQLQEADLPAPHAGQIAIKVRAAGVSLPDLLMIKGKHPIVPKPPLSPGLEVTGEIIAVGDSVAFSVGDRVMATTLFLDGWGGFAEYCLAEARNAVIVPSSMSDLEAAGFLVSYMTAYVALVQRTHLQKGETLLVLGASGSSGSTAIQMGKALGAQVIAVSSSQAKLEFCRTMGADHTLNYTVGDIIVQVRALTDGKGAEVVFDPVGGALGKQATRCIARHGRLGLVGYASDSWVQLDPLDIVLREYSAIGVLSGFLPPDEIIEVHSALVKLAQAGKIKTPVSKVIPFRQTPGALADLDKGELAGKLIIEM